VGTSAPVDVFTNPASPVLPPHDGGATPAQELALRFDLDQLSRPNRSQIEIQLEIEEVRSPVYFLASAADYDGTIANHGFVDESTAGALRQPKETGRRLVLVTGRELADLRHAFPEITIFDRVVAENGAVIYDPATGQEHVVAAAAPIRFVEKLMERKVEPISVGRSIVATWEPHQATVLNVIQELGLELQIIFNKGAVMVLPPGVNKASGLAAALAELDIAVHNVVGVGDAENDHAFLHLCGCAADPRAMIT
jgi:HAD superfamily hydrolase (TIGR01484 family)